VIMLTAIALPVLLLMTSFAIDLGRQRALRRTMQAKADVIALDLSRLLDGSTPANAIAYSAPLAASASRNNVALAKIQSVQWGTLDKATGKFLACPNCVPEAVKVTTHDTQDNLFQTGEGSATRSAVAASRAIAGFSIGSFAAAVKPGSDPSGFGSGLLNALLGDALNTSVLGYSGLATANVTYLQIANELGLGTPNELFTGDVSAYDALDAQAEILRRGGNNAAQVAVMDAILAVPNSPLHDVSVGEVANVQAGGENAALASTVNVLDFLTTAAFIANGSSGLAIPSTLLGIPGLSGNIGLNLIQSPQTVYGPIGVQARTSQADLVVTIPVNSTTACGSTTALTSLLTSLLGSVGNLLNILLTAPLCNGLNRLVNLTTTATFTIHLANATGTLDRVACTSSNEQMGVRVQSGLVSTTLALSIAARIGSTNLTPIGVTLGTTGNGATSRADFVLPPELFDVFKQTTPPSGNLGLIPLELDSKGLGLFLTPLHGVLDDIISRLDARLVQPLTKMLGIRVASADIAPRLVSCDAVQLVG
jgi:uncharacterized membrane protein